MVQQNILMARSMCHWRLIFNSTPRQRVAGKLSLPGQDAFRQYFRGAIMPVYDYLCSKCGPITALRPMSVSAAPICCPVCRQDAPRAFLQAPHMSGMTSERRSAFECNETSRHAPKVSTRDSREVEAADKRKTRHPSGCPCCSGTSSSRSSAVFTADGSKVFPSKRPWMISH